MSEQLDELSFMAWLKDECGYVDPVPIGGGRWAAIAPLMFHWTLMVGRIGDRAGFDDKFCYRDRDGAALGLLEWAARKFEGEPNGWHRNPRTGRRRDGGNAESEYVAP